MNKIIKSISLLAIFCLVILLGFFYFLHWTKTQEEKKLESFYSKVKISEDGNFDIRKYDDIIWDELVILTPYENLCNYGIKGYPENKKNCLTNLSDGECILFFLNNNQLIQKIRINRSIVDFSYLDISKKRLKRAQSIFHVDKDNNAILAD